MIEKLKINRCKSWESGYVRPSGKRDKRLIHKKLRRLQVDYIFNPGIMNRIGSYYEWS